MEEIQSIRVELASLKIASKDAAAYARIQAHLANLALKLSEPVKKATPVRKNVAKPKKEPKFLSGPNMAINLSGYNNAERKAMREFFEREQAGVQQGTLH